MSARGSIVKTLAEKLKLIDGVLPYQSNMYGNVSSKLVFWDEVNDYPYICTYPSAESREYLPGGFKWGFLTVSLKVYVRGEEPQEMLEKVFADIEYVIDNNQELQYAPGRQTEEINITSIVTDEGLLAPIGVGDITLQVRYQVF